MSRDDQLAESVADYLWNAGCGTRDECERIARGVLNIVRDAKLALFLRIDGKPVPLSQFPDLKEEGV